MEVNKKAVYSGHRDCVYTLLCIEKTCFFSAAGDGMLVKWNFDRPEEGELIAKVPNSIYAISKTKIENQILIGQNFEGIHLIDTVQNKEIRSIKITESHIFDIQVFENIILVACGDGYVQIIDFEKFTVISKIKLSDKSARTIAINPLVKEFAVGYSDNSIRIFKLTDFSLQKEIFSHTISVFGLAFSPDYKYLTSVSRDAHLKIWDCWDNYVLVDDIVAHMYAINHVAYSPDNRYFTTCSMDKSIKIWDAQTHKLLKVVDKSRHAGHATSVNKTLWINNNSFLSCSDDKLISLWEIK